MPNGQVKTEWNLCGPSTKGNFITKDWYKECIKGSWPWTRGQETLNPLLLLPSEFSFLFFLNTNIQ